MKGDTRAQAAKKSLGLSVSKNDWFGLLDHKKLWWMALGGGIFFILLAGVVNRPFTIGLVFPLSVMVLYWLIGVNLATREGTQSQFADSLYYLGFLFTLTALAAALYFLARPGVEWNEEVRNALIGRFGLALGTTILGLALRVAIVNLQPTEEGGLESAEYALGQSIVKFRDQLELHTDRLGLLSDKQHETLSTVTETAYAALSAQTKTAGAELSTTAHSMSRSMQQVTDQYVSTFKEKTEQMTLPDEYLRDQLEGPINEFIEISEDLRAGLKESVEAQRAITRSAKRMAEKYESVTDASETMIGFVETGAKTVTEMNRMLASFQRLESTISSVEPAFRNASQAIQNEADQVVQASASLGTIVEQSRSIASAIGAQVAALQSHNKSLEQELMKSRLATSRVHKDLTDAVDGLRKEIVDR